MADGKISYRDEIAGEIIARIEAGTAPWQKPWQAGTLGTGPFNPISGKPYRGINDLWLTLQGRGDPRWMTYRQALEQGAQVRKGERSATIEYWQWTMDRPMVDAAGNPVLDSSGRPRRESVRLDRPRVFYAKVFNADQIDGLAAYMPPPAPEAPARIARAEAIIAGAGVPVFHDQRNRAFYRPATDQIHLPPIESFKGTEAYYETALHELGHATGHHSRLARDFGPFGSEGYAREELRAEIASYMLARDMGISFDPSNHAAYVESWLRTLQEDKNEIFRAARDAETIKTWVMEPERRQELEQTARRQPAGAETAITEDREPAMTEEPKRRTFIAVPFAEKDEAKAAGAKWDRQAKSWYLPEGVDPAGFTRWANR
ncbi:zincin-like metallopeptidase domain-containing protein [Magnetospirillum sp. UT-4]|uniref:zincin-like metallopeptidase domain-containing protein n=1 Tax=Magnetospirillum sp. UT-4 TaxID=2681467 RepID=UPI00138414DC